MTITLVSIKGGPLTASEFDGNFTDLDGRVDALEGGPGYTPAITSAVSGTTWTLTIDGVDYVATIPTIIQTPPAVITVTGATFVPSLVNAQKYIRCTNATACAITVPTYATIPFPTGTELHFVQAGAGALSVAPATDVTIHKRADRDAATDTQGAVLTLKKIATDEWDLFGDLAAS